MTEIVHYLVVLAASVALVWLCSMLRDVYERILGEPPSLARWLKRRNRPTTLFGNNDQDVL